MALRYDDQLRVLKLNARQLGVVYHSAMTPKLLTALLTCASIFAFTSDCDAAQVATGRNFVINADTIGDCKANTECTVKLTLVAAAGFHVNKDFPWKLTANDLAGVDHTGKDPAGKNVFSKTAGDFTTDANDVKLGYLAWHFKPSHAGAITLTGTYRVCVCTDSDCRPDTATVSVNVTVK
jgi:hypothetical protein